MVHNRKVLPGDALVLQMVVGLLGTPKHVVRTLVQRKYTKASRALDYLEMRSYREVE